MIRITISNFQLRKFWFQIFSHDYLEDFGKSYFIIALINPLLIFVVFENLVLHSMEDMEWLKAHNWRQIQKLKNNPIFAHTINHV